MAQRTMNEQSYRIATEYPEDKLTSYADKEALISYAEGTIPKLFAARVAASPEKIAYTQYSSPKSEWKSITWKEMGMEALRWQCSIASDHIATGTRAAIGMHNCREWVLCDQACLAAGLVVTPLYVEDRADNMAYILQHTDTQILFLRNYRLWRDMEPHWAHLPALKRVVIMTDGDELRKNTDTRLMSLAQWLDAGENHEPATHPSTQPGDLATIVYTSGTTGKPKGVMLSHTNILTNALAGLRSVTVLPEDKFLSFLPLSHMFERTVGYYLPMMVGAQVTFNRSIMQLVEDLSICRPTMMICVPRVFERAYHAILARLSGFALQLFKMAVHIGWQRFEIRQGRGQWQLSQLMWPLLDAVVAKKVRTRFGGQLRYVISGGAPLPSTIARVFIALGIDILQGYGLTETGPTLTVNTPMRNNPLSIGLPLIGTEIRLSSAGELQARNTSVMQGYWQNEDATKQLIDADGWLSTGDIASIDDNGFIRITGRLKEIIVLSTGEKIPPADVESAICEDTLFEQAMIVGEGRVCLSALLVLDNDVWQDEAKKLGVDAHDTDALTVPQVTQYLQKKVSTRLRGFPVYAKVRAVRAFLTPWTVADGTLTPTLKMKRSLLAQRFAAEIEGMYATKK